jgi:outer membrane protein OmpA-like peptidoglycan-associated protein
MRKSYLIITALLAFASVVGAEEAYHAEPITGTSYKTPNSTTVIVHFKHKSATFMPTQEDEQTLADAPNAALITINGRTSTPRASYKDEKLSLARAVAARRYLIDHGVSPLKIAINYVSAADYIVEDFTPEAQKENRRVEIELVYVSPEETKQGYIQPVSKN